MKHTINALTYLTGTSMSDHPTSALGTLEFAEHIKVIMLISSCSN